MRRVLVLLLLISCVHCAAQKKVSDLLVNRKSSCDSLMRIQYGNELFEKYFALDSFSGGYFGHGFQHWNESVEHDSAAHYMIWYYFRYPGALIDSSYKYGFHHEKDNRPTRGSYGGKCCARLIKITPQQLDSITHEVINQPLSACKIRRYDFIDFHDSLYTTLDSTHVFLEAEYDSIRYYGRKNRRYELLRRTIVIDAYKVSLVADSTLHYKGQVHGGIPTCGMRN